MCGVPKQLLARLVLGLLIFHLIVPSPARAAQKLTVYSPAEQKGKPAQFIWQLSGVGRLSGDIMVGPNGLLYLPVGNKLAAVDTRGRVVWEAAGPAGGRMGRPVFGPAGSIFLPGSTVVQEIKMNGAAGWSFSAFQGSTASGPAWLSSGPRGYLYLPLPAALYAVDTIGRYKWALLHWDAGDLYRAVPLKDRAIDGCAGDERAVYVVCSRRQAGSTLLAVDGAGKILWRYWLGEIKEVHLVPGGDGVLYATVNPSKLDKLNKGKVYAFRPEDSGRPAWSQTIPFDDLTAPVLSPDKTLYFTAGGRIYALDAQTGQQKWYQPLLNLISAPAVDGRRDRIYAGTSDKRLLAVGAGGRLIWDLELDGAVSRPPLVGPDGYLYVVTAKGSLYKILDAGNSWRLFK
ncbi:PQQ-binding-like beta-propeller repeat protein [Desulfofundulus sp. TPOSR]|uniref:outer membrane protein assembly factor BamB family protein n=1 Tax=Desulfofundulus sp. TPOSR TaxID=2714340 RepID=UPI00140AC5DE|nr:PQQ-binding-like beta-propeller repeat protein [Desulfofundulus sp. TPOSR]NHM28260.1 PQQ-binding-like beta-propeller repeat protein [Desulfofundulus sp. TPOSR]